MATHPTRLKTLSYIFSALLLAPAAALAGESVTYDVDGERFEGYFAPAQGESRGGVLLMHDWDGLTGYEEKRADMLAELGYDTFAIDLYGQGNRPAEVDARKEETAKLYDDRERMRTLTLAGLEQAREQGLDEVVVMGYCFGGAVILEQARSGEADNIQGYASFHGSLGTPEGQSYPEDTPPLLIAHGGADSSVSLDDVATLAGELEEAGATYQIEIYSGAPHAFTVFDGDRYQERADILSWNAFTAFLERQL
ncbi:dienelactone hydrolase family protein [Litchfieldella xinjiangensis]|uniref:dienelactone hydrolase family protein n=1 Tax=Litchfieldella xinjiangensis TaxID=1166948 RepID=UPI0009DDB7A3|nr:dienelactone hydrolase family protein [Halomonas xinjiangensis]